MNFKHFCITILIVNLIVVLFNPFLALAVGGSFNVNITVDSEAAPGVCNNNGVCDAGETTANCPADCPAPVEEVVTGGGGELPDTQPPVISDIVINPLGQTFATINWHTHEQAVCTLYLGQTIDYEKATVQENSLILIHVVSFNDLTPQTLYNFKISCHDQRKNKSETLNLQFSALSPPDFTPPPNVSDFTAEPGDKEVFLNWQNPFDEDFEHVLIVRSQDFYPEKPWQGQPVYLGKEPIIRDDDVENYVTYYYTAFSYDKNGNYSSGAIAKATPPVGKPEPQVKPPIGPAPAEVEGLRLEDFAFLQKGRELVVENGLILEILPDAPLTAQIDYEKVPEVLKTIMVTLEKDGKYFSFLLRINEDKTKYSATLQPPEPGNYPFSVSVLDYQNQALKVIKGNLQVDSRLVAALPQSLWILFLRSVIDYWPLLLLLGLLLIIYYWHWRYRRSKKNNYV